MTRHVRATGGFAPLSAHYYKDDAILAVGPMAELLFVRSLAFCTEVLSDGFITERQLSRLVAPDLVDVSELAVILVNGGLWERVNGGYLIRSWLKWNRSREEITRSRAIDAARKREGAAEDDVEDDVEVVPDGIHVDSVGIGQPSLSLSLSPSPSLSKNTSLAELASESFAEFWSAYPRKAGKRNAQKAYLAAVKRGISPDLILKAAKLYAESRHGTDLRFTKHPSSWLNGGYYDDEPEPPPPPSGHQPYRDPKPEDYLAPEEWGDES